jgi:hypothetical protein
MSPLKAEVDEMLTTTPPPAATIAAAQVRTEEGAQGSPPWCDCLATAAPHLVLTSISGRRRRRY